MPTDHVSPRPPVPTVAPTDGSDPAGHLATGWEPHREVDDGLVRRFVYAYAASFAGHAAAMQGHVVQREAYAVWDHGRPTGFFNGAMLLAPLPYDGWKDVVACIEGDLAGDGSGDVILFSAWPTPDLADSGWTLVGHPPMLLRPAGPLPGGASPSWLDVRPVADAESLADWEYVAIEGYPLDECRPVRPGVLADERVLDDPGWSGWVGYADGRPVTIGTSYVAHGLHVFTLGVTLPAYRGRGAWRAMAAVRLAAFPDLPAMSIFSDMSRGPAEGVGFLPLARWTLWERRRDRRP